MTTQKWFILAALVCFGIAGFLALSGWRPAPEGTPGGLALFFTDVGLFIFMASFLVA